VTIGEAVAELVAGGVATIVATRDERLRPSIARAWGVKISDDGSALTLCVEAPDDSPTRSNLIPAAPIAVTCSRPTTYRTVQLKGEVTAVRAPEAGDLASVDEHVGAFSREAEKLGLAADCGRRLLGPELLAVGIRVHEIYDQTPGPGAGGRW